VQREEKNHTAVSEMEGNTAAFKTKEDTIHHESEIDGENLNHSVHHIKY